MIEALLPPQAMKGETTRMTRDRLCGLNAIILRVAHNAGVGEIAMRQRTGHPQPFHCQARREAAIAKQK